VPFQRILTKKKSTHVAEQILQAIMSGQYRVGDRLPPERVLAEEMGVSRPSVREALSALQIVGVVTSRVGDGTYVRSAADTAEALQVMALLEESPSLVDVLEARQALEVGVVHHIVRQGAPQGLGRLRQALGAMEQAAQAADYDAFSLANLEFHLALVAASGNPLIEQTIRPLLEVMRQELALELRRKFYQERADAFARAYQLHEAIVRAVEARDLVAAVAAMERHFSVIEEALRE
jgi:GntR family transcriptional repressor for pyruvate dehydrogenase complex